MGVLFESKARLVKNVFYLTLIVCSKIVGFYISGGLRYSTCTRCISELRHCWTVWYKLRGLCAYRCCNEKYISGVYSSTAAASAGMDLVTRRWLAPGLHINTVRLYYEYKISKLSKLILKTSSKYFAFLVISDL